MLDPNYQSLQDAFGFEQLDIRTRDFAGVYVDSKICCANEHLVALRACKANNTLNAGKPICFLHFKKHNNGLICFVDSCAIFSKVPFNEVTAAIVKEFPEVNIVYEYKSNRVRILFERQNVTGGIS